MSARSAAAAAADTTGSTIAHLADPAAGDQMFRIGLPHWSEQRAPAGEARWDKRRRRWVQKTWRPVWEPLSANYRGHWRPKHDATATVRGYVELEAGPRRADLPHGEHLIVRLHYRPTRDGSRDGGNLAPLSKACIDGLARGPQTHRRDRRSGLMVRVVGLDLVPDDTGEYVTEMTPVILPLADDRAPALWLDVIIRGPYRPEATGG